MSKKSHPGDGQYGRGVKGTKKPFEDVFMPHKTEARAEQNDEAQRTDEEKK